MSVSILAFVSHLSGSTPTLYGIAISQRQKILWPKYVRLYQLSHQNCKGGFSYACWRLLFC